MAKFTSQERALAKSIIATLSIKKIEDKEIIKEIYGKTNKMISRMSLYNLRQQIKRDSFKWYKTMREGEYEYIHEFKDRINEILDLQKRHYEIIDNESTPTPVKQTSLAELHRLNITLSNYYDVAPSIIGVGNNATISVTPETKSSAETREYTV